MANELKHGSVGTELTQAEWEAVGTHVIANQAVGDIIYASTTAQLSRLAKGTDTHVLTLSSGIPAWSATTGITTVGTIATGVWQGTDVGVAYGGTGVSTLTSNAVLTGNGASAITAEANLTFDGSTLTLDGDLEFTGPQTISTSSGALSLQIPAGGDIDLVNAADEEWDLKFKSNTTTQAGYIRTEAGGLRVGGSTGQGGILYKKTGGILVLETLDLYSTGTLLNVGASGNDWTATLLAMQDTALLKVGSTSAHGTTAGTNLISLFNGTAPVGPLANGASFFCASGQMKVIQADGAATDVSPHNPETGEWWFNSKDVHGRVFRVHVERLMRRLDEMLGGGFIEEFTE
jgi:hypothetical protein